jgi:hypothetical protein
VCAWSYLYSKEDRNQPNLLQTALFGSRERTKTIATQQKVELVSRLLAQSRVADLLCLSTEQIIRYYTVSTP